VDYVRGLRLTGWKLAGMLPYHQLTAAAPDEVALEPHIMVADGVTGFREIAALAGAHTKTVIPHHGGGNLGTVAQLHAIASWSHAPWIEILHDPPVAAYTNGFPMTENPPLVACAPQCSSAAAY
jgi:L-alanine-DL-glutamate epimerase-like enolase superfamily enzyme